MIYLFISIGMCLSTEKNANPSRGDEIENERQESEKPTIQIFTIFIQRDELEGVGLSFQGKIAHKSICTIYLHEKFRIESNV